ncbi:MAG: DNA cytosine methyltransferase [Nitrososphaerales archaeon]
MPALVALTATQIPIVGPRRRFLSRREGLRLQGFPEDHLLPQGREAAFRALGNAVHVDLAAHVAKRLVGELFLDQYLETGEMQLALDASRGRVVSSADSKPDRLSVAV